ncbi:uncharacterized protein LOC115356499 isoform X2 [Myripristis murdjan]|uniref:uncharacterized protein LOC115356499 isoform X2 n=1 Tax=Myripristis murdjan TaxID=586833 RepID=UPI001175FF13|nr:uncharacterized protein LOC115356499 isoform X2 [Myripristis murdjan]XP_029903544.1 uncharacterized protein LOC115356499 isoform X2 [Myripristis murdjan]
MDFSKLWQLRVMYAMRSSTDPFYHCKNIGLDFNAASQRKPKLDLQLLTNGIVYEVYDFANLVNKSKRQFIIDVLENNFDIGLESKQQRSDFCTRTLLKVKQLMKRPWIDKHELFSLPDTSSMAGHNHGSLTQMSNPKSSDIYNADWSLATAEHDTAESVPRELDRLCAAEAEQGDEDITPRMASTEESKEDVFPHSYPFCKEIGLNLGYRSKQTLDMGLLTNGVMLEIEHFARILCGFSREIILNVLEHNFELDFTSLDARDEALRNLNRLLAKKAQIKKSNGAKTSLLEMKFFSSHVNPSKRKRDETLLSKTENIEGPAPKYHHKEVMKRRQYDVKSKQTKNMALNETDVPTSHTTPWDQGLGDVHSYMCPLEDSDLESDDASDSENNHYQESMQNENGSPNLNIPRESEMRSLEVLEQTFLSPTDCSSAHLSLNPDLSPALATCSDRGQSEGQSPRQTTTNVKDLDDSDTMEQKETGAEQLMWKLRTHRVNEIFLRSAKNYCSFHICKRLGLDFSVGSGVKQKLNAHSLTNSVLLEVCKFAVAMNSSQQEFIMEILEYNFDLRFISGQQRHVFACETMHRVRQLTQCEDEVRFSKEAFELPVDKLKLTTNPKYHYSCCMSVNPKISRVSTMKVKDVAPVPSTNCNELVPEQQVDLYPHCMEIGLKLHVKKHETHKKLDFSVLTKGAMIEVTNFAKMLCGTFEQIIIDVLDHNYDLDLQNGESDTARYILAQIPVVMDHKNLTTCIKNYPKKYFPLLMRSDEDSEPKSDSGSTVPSQTKITDHLDSCTETQQKLNEQEKTLWTLRNRRSQEILSVPHLEDCPLYSFSRCKKIGIDFNVGCGVKQNLDPKLLTNAVILEIGNFATAVQESQRHFVREILEYNFDLGLKSDLERHAFAHQTMATLKVNSRPKKLYSMKNKIFKLPDLSCIDLSDYVKAVYCPKCDQDRNLKRHGMDESQSDVQHHPSPHAKMDTAQRRTWSLSSTLPRTEGAGMNPFPKCKKIGLSLCVDEDQPQEKLGLHLLTHGVMREVASFSLKLSGFRRQIVNDILEHNFNLCIHIRESNPSNQFFTNINRSHPGHAWLSEVVSFCTSKRKPSEIWKNPCFMEKCQEWKKKTEERQLALQQKKENSSLRKAKLSIRATKKHQNSEGNFFPLCKKIGLDLDVESKSAAKAKLDLKLLTRAVVFEIHKYVATRAGAYIPSVLYDILNYNFDLSSQNHRCWEFSLAVTQKVTTMVKSYQRNLDKAEEVFELPFVFSSSDSEDSIRDESETNETFSFEYPDSECEKEGRRTPALRLNSDLSCVYLLDEAKPLIKINEQIASHHGGTESSAGITTTEAEEARVDALSILQVSVGTMTSDCDRLVHDNESFSMNIKEEQYDPYYDHVEIQTGWHHGDASHPETEVEIKQEDDH